MNRKEQHTITFALPYSTKKALDAFVKKSKTRSRSSIIREALRRGAAEALEIIAHGDSRSSKVVGRRLDEIDLPEGVTIGAIVRGDEVLIAHSHLTVASEDHLILFLGPHHLAL